MISPARAVLVMVLTSLLTWIIAADQYGMVLQGEPTFGFMCRAFGYDAILMGDYPEREMFCTKIPYLTPEDDLWDAFLTTLQDRWSYPR